MKILIALTIARMVITTNPDCEISISFCIDTSSSITDEEFEKEKILLAEIFKTLLEDIGRYIKTSTFTFAGSVEKVFGYYDYNDALKIYNAIKSLRRSSNIYDTRIGECMKKVFDYNHNIQNNGNKILIIITDGNESDFAVPSAPKMAQILIKNGYKIFPIGYGESKKNKLFEISGRIYSNVLYASDQSILMQEIHNFKNFCKKIKDIENNNNNQFDNIEKCDQNPLKNSEDNIRFIDCREKIIGEECHFICVDLDKVPETYPICQSNGKWSENAKCKAFKCTSPPKNKEVDFSHCEFMANSECNYKCTDTNKKPTSTIKCDSNLVLDGDFTCEMKECDFRNISLAEIDVSLCNFTVGSECNYECKNRKKVPISSIKCESDQNWSEIPNCVFEKCEISDFNDFDFTNCDLKIGSICNYKCIDITKEPVSFIICQPNRQWNVFPNCEVKKCEKIDENNINYSNCDFGVGNTCIYSCKDENKEPKSDIKCNLSKKWNEEPQCIYKKCPIPSNIDMDFTNCDFGVGNTCIYSCKDENKEPKSDIKCSLNKKWNEKPKCISKKCPIPSNIDMDFTNCDFGVGNTCIYSCKDENKEPKSDIKCNLNKKWNEKPKCIYKKCPIPLNDKFLKEIDFSNCDFKIKSTCEYQCLELFKKPKSPIKCQKGLKWDNEPKCIISHCILPPIITNLTSINIKKFDCEKKLIGEICDFECSDNRTKNSLFPKCLNNGYWSHNVTCKPIICKYPPIIKNTLEIDASMCFDKNLGEKCDFKCIEFTKRPKTPIKCIAENNWSEAVCVKKPFFKYLMIFSIAVGSILILSALIYSLYNVLKPKLLKRKFNDRIELSQLFYNDSEILELNDPQVMIYN